MALDTLASITGKVLLRCPSASSLLVRDWVSNAFRRVAERRSWSWLIKRGQFLTVASYSTGTCTVTHNSTAVTGAGTAWTNAMIGRQFFVSGNPIYTITAVGGVGSLTLDDEYGGDTNATASYQIYKAYMEVPTDFHAFISVWDTATGRTLNTTTTQRELQAADTERGSQGDPSLLAFLDYYLPTGQTVMVPRYEMWPHPVAKAVYPFIYEMRPTDLEDSGATLPRFLHGDVLLEMSLEQAAMWPGPSKDKINPYFNRDLAVMHRNRSEQLIMEMERQDEEVGVQNIYYDNSEDGFQLGADYWQKHAIQ